MPLFLTLHPRTLRLLAAALCAPGCGGEGEVEYDSTRTGSGELRAVSAQGMVPGDAFPLEMRDVTTKTAMEELERRTAVDVSERRSRCFKLLRTNGASLTTATGDEKEKLVAFLESYGVLLLESGTLPSVEGDAHSLQHPPRGGRLHSRREGDSGECLDAPQSCVDRCDAFAYCKAMGKRLCGRVGGGSLHINNFDDASKSQWQNACSSGGKYAYPYGPEYEEGACRTQDLRTVATLPSCQSPEDGYAGVFDLSGNISEWEDACEYS